MPTTKPAPQQWIDAQTAADKLKLSKRTVLEKVAQGKLEGRKEYDPQIKQEVTMVSAAAVERALYEREHPPAPAPTTAVVRTATRALERAKPKPTVVPAPVATVRWHDTERKNVWFTLDEAEEYSGLPVGYLRELIKSGELKARNVGHRKGGESRISRRALDDLI